jgi:hypothetical protein
MYVVIGGYIPFNRIYFLDDVLCRVILLQPALRSDRTAGMDVLWELLVCKPVYNLIVSPFRPVNNIRENSVAHHDKV